MEIYRCSIRGITFSAGAEESLSQQVQILFQAVMTVPPEKIKDGFKLEIGFSVFFFTQTGSGYSISVPDYSKNPFTDISQDLTAAMRIQSEQTGFIKKYKISAEPVRFDDRIAVSKKAMQSELISLQRFTDLGGSGWCAEAAETKEDGRLGIVSSDEYELYYIYQLLNIRPAIIRALVLPYGYIAVFEGGTVKAILNEKNENIVHTVQN